ncbi:MAG TPA: outer membrane beta-barrel protein [Flavobacteriales bacterium]|nr:outer membrane beta-barrel protein [Flavobacteriales bacterium]
MKTILFRLGGKILPILAATAMAAPNLSAQDDAGVRLGIKVAPNMSWIKADTKGFDGDGSKIGFTFGLVTEFPIGSSGNYRFGTGLFLNYAGGNYVQTVTYPDANLQIVSRNRRTNKNKIGTVKLMTNEIGYSRYYGRLGFGAGYNLSAKADFESVVAGSNGVLGVATFTDEDIKDNIQPFRVGLIVGGGMEYNFSGSTTVQIGINYHNGFTNLLKDVKVGDKKAKLLQNYLELDLAVFF